jgi:hypothetical protein
MAEPGVWYDTPKYNKDQLAEALDKAVTFVDTLEDKTLLNMADLRCAELGGVVEQFVGNFEDVTDPEQQGAAIALITLGFLTGCIYQHGNDHVREEPPEDSS